MPASTVGLAGQQRNGADRTASRDIIRPGSRFGSMAFPHMNPAEMVAQFNIELYDIHRSACHAAVRDLVLSGDDDIKPAPGAWPEDIVVDHVAAGRLQCVLDDWCPTFAGYHLYYPSRRQSSPAFVLVVEALRAGVK